MLSLALLSASVLENCTVLYIDIMLLIYFAYLFSINKLNLTVPRIYNKKSWSNNHPRTFGHSGSSRQTGQCQTSQSINELEKINERKKIKNSKPARHFFSLSNHHHRHETPLHHDDDAHHHHNPHCPSSPQQWQRSGYGNVGARNRWRSNCMVVREGGSRSRWSGSTW